MIKSYFSNVTSLIKDTIKLKTGLREFEDMKHILINESQ